MGLCERKFKAISIVSGLLAVVVCLGLVHKSRTAQVIDDPIQVSVQPDRSKEAHIGDLCVTLRNRSKEDLVFHSYDLPWVFNAGGLRFVIYREDGSVVSKTPMIADPMVGRPTLLKRGKELSQGMSLLVYYVDLPKELASHDLKVNWSYVPEPTNLIIGKTLRGEFLLKKHPQSGENLER
jgi:hypothetical protein